MTDVAEPPLSFESHDADGSPRVCAGWFRLGWNDTLREFRADCAELQRRNIENDHDRQREHAIRERWGDVLYASIYDTDAQLLARWQKGMFDRPLYEARRETVTP